MALTNIEKSCLLECQGHLTRKSNRSLLSTEEKASLEQLVTGTETQRRAIIMDYITNTALPGIDESLASIEVEKARLETQKTDLEAYIA